MALAIKDLIDWLDNRSEKTMLPEGVMEDLKVTVSDMGMSDEGRALFLSLIKDYENLSSELQDQIAYTEALADVDPMLQIATRRNMMSIIIKEWEGAKRYHNAASIIMFRLDQVLALEDRNPTLIKLAKLIKSRTRMTDTLGRLDEDRFILVVPTTNNIQATWLSGKLREAIEESLEVDGMAVTCSFGVADSDASMHPEDWLKITEVALEKAYTEGGDQVVDFESLPEYMN